ncbi:hypothetical protein ABZ413_37175, partial [Nocardia rhamnosiphila]|uniref:hypothetical protein n=1 Tax=Nocardia rhamnosiphila TaxID=426716 RepID=UPI0033C7AD6F
MRTDRTRRGRLGETGRSRGTGRYRARILGSPGHARGAVDILCTEVVRGADDSGRVTAHSFRHGLHGGNHLFGARRELLGEGAPHIVVAEAAFRLLQAGPQP